MRKIFILFFVVLLTIPLSSQVIYNNRIDSIVNLVSSQSLSRFNRELSGDTVVNIGGVPQILYSRFYKSPEKYKAIQYLDEKFQSFGLTPKHMQNNDTNINVYAVKLGTKFPNQKFIVCGHYDDILWPVNPGLYDTLHGADDDASGVCAVLEVARLIANMNFDYTILFVTHDCEEPPPYILGSKAFADSCYFRGDSILGVLNLDMIAYDGNNDFKSLTYYNNNNSLILSNDLKSCNLIYQIGMNIYSVQSQVGNDIESYWNRGFKGIEFDEDYYNDVNPYIHSLSDSYNKLNIPYIQKMVKISVATLLTWVMDYKIYFNHVPIPSSSDTNSKVAEVKIHFPVTIASGTNAPRLYYKVGNGNYNYTNAFYINGETYRSIIPGYPSGSKISYYLAAQDLQGNNIATLPAGGSGINPPGTTPPPTQFVYYVLSTNNYCSNIVKPINDLAWTEDTIHISQQGIVRDVQVTLNINHSNDGDLLIRLNTPNNGTTLSQYNGQGGQNYTNTVFDDSATISIKQGTPPFTGTYKPEGTLSTFNNQQMSGDWILRIFDINNGNQGNLLNWCIKFTYESQIGIKKISTEIPYKFKLYQNYPNPFNPSTIIRFQIKELRFVTLKIYDILGKEIAVLVNEVKQAGNYIVDFNASSLPSGIYFYKITSSDFSCVNKMMLLK